MTGHQENPGSGRVLSGDPAPVMNIVEIVKSFGFKHIFEINPNDISAVRKAFDDALALDEPSVIITVWPCPLKRMDEAERKMYGNPFTTKCVVDDEKCNGCKLCIRCGCPALSMNREKNKAEIDFPQCVGCDVCVQICPKNAIAKEAK
jgi:indolepyruvate ferredoxin oxidoreductase alpha subunit